MNTYLFDFDGTLVDSMPTYAAVMLRILDEYGIKYEKDIIKTITPLGFLGTAKYYIEELGVAATVDELTRKMGDYCYEEYLLNIPEKSNVKKVLEALKSRGNSLNVLTASPHLTLDPCLKRLGIYDLFDNVWSCNDFQTTKSDPKIYLFAAQKLGVPVKDVIFLDDNIDADKTAKAAGAKVIGVYDKSSEEYEMQIRAITDAYVRDFSELLTLDI